MPSNNYFSGTFSWTLRHWEFGLGFYHCPADGAWVGMHKNHDGELYLMLGPVTVGVCWGRHI